MTDKRKHSRSRRTEDLSPAELREQIEEDKKKAGRSTVFLLAALVAIIVICIAWFVANTRVRVTTGTIGAQDSTLFELASVGKRQTVESEYLRGTDNKNLLTDGQSKMYDVYYDEQGKKVSAQQTYYAGTADLAWRLGSENVRLSPGASGKLEFYIIPKVANLTSVTVKLEVSAYAKLSENADKATKMNDETVQNLLKGHLLLFRNFNDKSGYSDWISENQFKVDAPKNTSGTAASAGGESSNANAQFEKDKPYKVTIYWIWPKYFSNYIYKRNENGNLFANISETNVDYTNLLKFVQAQSTKAQKDNQLFYNGGAAISIGNNSIDSDMPDETLNICTNYYNLADEYIGQNAKYIYINAEATGGQTGAAAGQ